MGQSYEKVTSGDRFLPRMKGWRIACCDCGLVHVMNFELVVYRKKPRIEVHILRDDRASAAMRRGRRYAGLKLPKRKQRLAK